MILPGGGVAHLKRERARWLWELIDSTTVDDFSCKTRVRKLQSTISSGKFLSCGSNVRARVSKVLGNELTTVGEADDSIEKRK